MGIASTHKRSTLGSREALMTGRSTWVRLGSMAVVAGLLGLACTDDLTDIDSQITVTVTPAALSLASIGEQAQLAATVAVAGGSAPSPIWVTRNVDVAAVGDDGRVLAVANGETWVVALAEADGSRGSDSARVVVSQVPASLRVETTVDTLTWLGATTRLGAAALDARGNPIADARVAWASSDAASARVDTAGLVTAVANGAATISASLGDLAASVTLAVAQQVATVTVAPSAAAINVGATQQFGATATDAGGTTVTGVKFLWVSANANVAVVDTTGLATGTGVGAVTVTAVGRGEPGNAVLTVGSAPAAPTNVAFSVQPTTSTAGQALSPAVEVEIRDAGGNLVTSARDAVTLAIAANPGTGTLAGTKTVTAVNGIASFSGLWINKAAAGYTLMATSGTLTSATSSAFAINPGAPAQLTFGAQPTNALGNTVIAPSVTVTISDAFGNVVTTAADAITLSLAVNPWASVFGPGAALSGTTTKNAVSGVAAFDNLRVDKPGTGYRVAAAGGGVTGATSDPFNINLTMQSVATAKQFGSHTCGVASSGSYCWGSNWIGQLGGVTGNSTRDSVAVLVQGGLTFVEVTAGEAHSCGITAAGAAYCWGDNWAGQLGTGNNNPSATPAAVTGGRVFTSIRAGSYHTCGLVGTAIYCWGYDGNGGLGDDATLANKNAPTIVAGGFAWKGVSGGYTHTCGATTGGDAYCWGNDGSGQLGDDATLAQKPTPALVAGTLTWASVSAGYQHTCGVTTANVGYCWGADNQGQLGNDATIANSPTPVVVFGSLALATVSAGGQHSCGVTTGGTAYCWGDNGNSTLGDGNAPTDSPTRVEVSGGLTFSSISAGWYQTCGMVTGNKVYCWGRNFEGQLGDGARVDRPTPVQIVQ